MPKKLAKSAQANSPSRQKRKPKIGDKAIGPQGQEQKYQVYADGQSRFGSRAPYRLRGTAQDRKNRKAAAKKRAWKKYSEKTLKTVREGKWPAGQPQPKWIARSESFAAWKRALAVKRVHKAV